MVWNWQEADWPEFRWDAARLVKAEASFLRGSGVFLGSVKHLGAEETDQLTAEIITDEAMTTSAIEGEMLDRDSVQSSIRRQLGLAADVRRVKPAEQGIAEMMLALYQGAAGALTHETLFDWHRMLFLGTRQVHELGCYRTHGEPMQVVSGSLYAPKVHFEAPPAAAVPAEMEGFVAWFNRSAPGGAAPLPALTRAGVAHLYFESIHPFEDGNGRIGRAISEKAMAQAMGRPALTSLATTLLARRGDYYRALERSSRGMEITAWLAWFAGIGLEAQMRTQAQVEFVLAKVKLLDGLRGELNERQEKGLLRMLREGPEGFKGGLSAGNYMSITKASSATATRDLADLVEKGALVRTGELRHARYHLPMPRTSFPAVVVEASGEVRVGMGGDSMTD